MKKGRPNILWICSEQQRYDTIHAWGNKYINTPVLDSLTASGVSFTRTYCQCPVCTPSRGSFLTGRYPASTRAHRNGQESFPKDEVLVTKIMADNGYTCGLIGKLHLAASQMGPEARTDDGYSYYQWSHHPYPQNPELTHYTAWLRGHGIEPEKLYTKNRAAYGIGVPEEYHQTKWCADKAIEFITEHEDDSWLLSINPFDPHPPMDPPKEYLDRYDPETLPFPVFKTEDIEHQDAFAEIDQQSIRAADPTLIKQELIQESYSSEIVASVPPSQLDSRKLIAAYYAQIELLDSQIGRILEHLRICGQYDNTIILYHSDHGELLGDHGLYYKGCRFYEALVHVPLIISFPQTLINGVKSSALVELVDIVPTLLDICEIPVPKNIQGGSLLGILSGNADVNHHKEGVFSEYYDALGPGTLPSNALYSASHGIMFFDGKVKICVYDKPNLGELYKLDDDPNEYNDLWRDPHYSQKKLEMLQKLLRFYMRVSDAGPKRVADY